MTSTEPPGAVRAAAVKDWLGELLDAPQGARADLVARLRTEMPELEAEVLELYAAHEGDADRLVPRVIEAGTPSPRTGAAPATIAPPTTLGPYRIGEVIGEGGMATVYRAHQSEPIHREVAVKLLRPEVSTPEVVARFLDERQLLARLDHPGIARVIDAGETADGRAYLVMDLVEGRPIHEVCRDEAVPLSERIRLVMEVAEAVQHAHGRGVLHRDLKPSNVLVQRTERGLATVVIDFGIAKMVGADALPRDLQRTRAGQIVGTLESMSPEQAGFGDGVVDARSDVYSLGVLLYELLAERLPIRVEGQGIAALSSFLRRLEEEVPPAPSRVRPDGTLVDLPRATLDDVDCVVLRALSREPQRRYTTVAAFADDLDRALRGLAVDARPPTGGYLFSRFARRNRGLVTAGVAALLSLVVGISGVSFGLVREQAHAASLASALSESNELIDSYASLLLGARADRLGPNTPISEVVEDAARKIEADATLSSAARGRLACAAGEALHDLERSERAEQMLRLADSLLGASDPTLAHLHERSEVLYRLALIALDRGAPDEARERYGEAIEIIEGLVERGEAVASSLRWLVTLESGLSTVLDEDGDSMGAIPLQRDAMERLAELGGEEGEIATLHADLAITLLHAGDFEGAEREARAALDLRLGRVPANDMRVINATRLLTDALLRLGRREEGAQLMNELESAVTLDEADPRRALVAVSAAQARYETVRSTETAADLASAVESALVAFGPESRRADRLQLHAIDAALIDPDYDPGPPIAAVLGRMEERAGPDAPGVFRARLQLGRALARAGRFDEARPHLAAARDGFVASNSRRPPITDRIEDELAAAP
ncbi:MAG: serine/threonine-protein kinase [Planctomycetota bacterium]